MSEKNVLNLADTVHHMAHAFPGGIAALAQRMGKGYTVLKNKLNPNMDSHHLNIGELEEAVDLCNSDAVAEWACANRGGVFVKLLAQDQISDMALLETYTNLMAKFGQFSGNFNTSLADGKFSRAECDELKADGTKMQQALQTLLSRIEGLIDE